VRTKPVTDPVEKILFAILGFILGTATTLIVDLVRERRRCTGLVRLMRAEARAFVEACRWAEKGRFWTSTNARCLAELIRERYSKDPERWTARKSPAFQQAVADFYQECAALLEFISRHEEQERRGGATDATGIYEGIANRTEKLLVLLGEPEA
jgi:hypothetical protein